MAKLHREDRTNPGKALCGREMPRDHDDWSPDQESCLKCAAVVSARKDTLLEQALNLGKNSK